jgi:DNA polymerase III epsilon subunit-like protein
MEARRRYGRRRGRVPTGDKFLPRLGPAGAEPFATLDDATDSWSAERPAPETPIDALHFVALDCETTGQSPHHLVELGAVAFTMRDHLMSFETLVHSNDRINPYARRIHGIDAATLNVDTTRLAAKLFDLKDTIGLERLCRELGVVHRRPHHALADAEATAACFLELVRRGSDRFGWSTLGDLLLAGKPPAFAADVGVAPPGTQAKGADSGPRTRRRR